MRYVYLMNGTSLWQHLVHTNAVLKFKVTSHADLSGLVIVIANSCVYCVHVGMYSYIYAQ